MVVSDEILSDIYRDVGDTRYEKAMKYVKQGRVTITKVIYEDKNNMELYGNVIGNSDIYSNYIHIVNGEIVDVRCDCPDYETRYASCKHIASTLIEFASNPQYETTYGKLLGKKEIGLKSTTKLNNKDKYRNFKQIIQTFYQEEVASLEKEEIIESQHQYIKIVPKLIYNIFGKEMKLEFKIGAGQLYKLKNLTEFYDNMQNKEKVRYGAKLEFVHEELAFEEESKPLLHFILKYAEIIKYVNTSANFNYRYYGKTLADNCIILSNSGLDELFEILKGRKIEIETDKREIKNVLFIPTNPDITYKMEKTGKEEYTIVPSVEVYDYSIIEGKKYSYFFTEDVLYRCTKEFKNTNLKLLEIFRQNFTTDIKLNKTMLADFFSLVVPKLRKYIEISEEDKEEMQEYIPEELVTKVYLDFDENNFIIAEIRFCYGEIECNPLEEKTTLTIPRNIIKETESLSLFRKTGFLLDQKNQRFILVEEEAIYRFLSEDIAEYMNKFDVMVTDNFKSKEIKQPKLGSIGIRVENNLLDIDLTGMEYSGEELKEILHKYNIKKKYHRLKDGSFLELQDNEDLDFISNLESTMDLDWKQIEKGKIVLPVSRSLYLNRLLENVKNTQIVKDSMYKKMINCIDNKQMDEYIKVPKEMSDILRYYQKIGYQWLKNIEEYHLGGILADDMGLGKTLQILAVFLDYSQKTSNDKRLPSIVISPSSLALNWESEAKKFTPELKTLVIQGKLEERQEKIEHILDYDLVITSYDLLKRDIELYEKKDYIFQYAIADEAQYIKNSNTQNAKALKTIKANTRFALTGTPIENSLAELWSIFDYIMPGYLFSYRKFKQSYEMPIVKENDALAMKKLKMMIEPFILRRVKKEVLKELPEKSITVLKNEMEEEQLKVYLSYLAQAKEEAINQMSQNGFEKSQIKILALLTRLRQICCHPSLFIENYQGESNKLNQCMEIVKDAVESGHKILIFSVYTSMLEIIKKNLQKEEISFYTLTGQTKVGERVNLVEDFNQNEKVKVFLISLKAGGTGLNLTGADMVIHYDPWWNISAENQATDRAYRIGQKNNVQVYKLITKNSIEEKIFELQEKKAKLIDNMLDTNTTFVGKLSQEEIMNLFN